MKLRIAFALLLATLLSSCAAKNNSVDPAILNGTWSGHWGPSSDRQTEVVLELRWDGKQLTGTINPGLRAIELAKAEFDPQTGKTHMELDAPMPGGGTDHYTIDGKVKDKTMSGSFTRHNGGGDFNITRE